MRTGLDGIVKKRLLCVTGSEAQLLEDAETMKDYVSVTLDTGVMPGKDYVSVTLDTGVREHHQKRLVLCNLKEAYTHFKTVHPVVKVGFSKFAEL